MNQSELTARVTEAEAQLGQPLPADYRAFLLDDTNEDKFTGDYLLFDSMICEFFLDPGAYTREDPDWTQDFPFTPENPLVADVPESFYARLDNAATAAEYDAITEEQIDYLQKNFDEPALRGIAFLSDDGCNIYTAIILRGPARGQIWRHEITMDNADVQPYWHPFTKELLTFNDWRYFEQHRYLLTIDGRDDAQTYSIMNDRYGFWAMKRMIVDGTLTGLAAEDVDKPEPGQPTPEQPTTLVTPPAQPAAPTAAQATASAVTTNAAPVETEDTFDWMEDDYVHTSIGGDNLWDSDAGTLSFDSRRALVQLLQGPLVRAEQHPPIWKAILSDETALRQRLADMFLDLVVDEDAGIAFTRIANSGNPIRVGKEHYVDMPHVLRVKTLTIIDTIVLLDLRTRLGLAVPGERVIVDQEELRENASQFRALDDRDEATFNRRFDASLDRMRRDYSLLGDTETEGRYEVSPALKHIFDAQTVAGIKAEFEELLAREESK